MRDNKIAFITALALCALTFACGGSEKRVRSAQESQAMARFPALRFAPEAPSYVLVTPRVTDMVMGVREALAAFGLIVGFEIEVLDNAMKSDLGFSAMSLDDLADAGVAMDRGAIAFSTGFLPTFVVTVAEPDKLQRFLAEHRPGERLSVRRHRDREWFSFNVEEELAVQWVAWDEFLSVRMAMGDEIDSTAWLDGLFTEPTGPGRAALFAAIERATGLVPGADIGGMFDIRAFTEAVFELAPDDERDSLVSCLRIFDGLSGAVAVGADMDWSSATGALALGLTPETAAALRQHLIAQPPGYTDVRAEAEVYASLGVDLSWLDQRREALACPLLDDRIRLPGGIGPALYAGYTGIYGALLRTDLSGRDLRAVVGLGTRERARADELLDLIPQRRLLARKSTIAGQSVEVVAMPMLPRLAYRVDDRGLLLTVGGGVMERVLESPSDQRDEAQEPLDVLSLGIRPSRIGDLEEILVAIARYTGYSVEFAKKSYSRLSRYEYGAVDLTLEGDDLIMRLSMELAR